MKPRNDGGFSPAARSLLGGISELVVNAALAMIEAAAPRDEIEAALTV